jgi:uncharacterized protein
MNDNNQETNGTRRSRFNFSNNKLDPLTTEKTAKAGRRPRTGDAVKPKPERPAKDGPLIFNVATLLREPEGAHREYEYEQTALKLSDDPEDKPNEARNIEGFIKLTKVRKDVLTQGDGVADVTLECVRCLRDYEQEVEYEIEEIFRPSIDVFTGYAVQLEDAKDAGDLRIDGNHLLNLGEAIRQQILVSLPVAPVCGDDCPGYGAIMERVNSDVQPSADVDDEVATPADPRWAALSQLLDGDAKPKKGKK